MKTVTPCRLVVEEGDNVGMVYPLEPPFYTVGRGPENSIQIIDTQISRVHAQFDFKNPHWTVEDLQSKNGTLVNDKPIVSKVRLTPGDTIQVGDTTFSFELCTSLNDATGSKSGTSGVKVLDEPNRVQTSHFIALPVDLDTSGSVVQHVPESADERLRSIYEVGFLIQSFLDLDELLNKVMEIVCQVLEPTHACIMLYDEKSEVLVPEVTHRPSASQNDIVISGSILQQAIDDRVAVITEDAKKDERFKTAESVVVQRIRSAICVPFVAKDRVLGALYLDRREVKRSYNDNDLQWAAGVASQAAMAINVAMLHKEIIARREREREIQIARSIQMNLLPKSMPKIKGFEFGGLSSPARKVGGDYYDVMELVEGDLSLAIADVSGKGVPAALLLASVRSAIRIESRRLPDDGIVEVISRLNENVCQDSMSNMFVSMVLCYFEPETRRLTYCNAGHVYPIVRMPDGELIELESGGCFLGVMPGLEYEKGSIKLPEGSMVVFVTDGITEATDSDGDLFGSDRLKTFVAENHNLSAQEFCTTLQRHIADYQHSIEQSDDLTVLVMKAD